MSRRSARNHASTARLASLNQPPASPHPPARNHPPIQKVTATPNDHLAKLPPEAGTSPHTSPSHVTTTPNDHLAKLPPEASKSPPTPPSHAQTTQQQTTATNDLCATKTPSTFEPVTTAESAPCAATTLPSITTPTNTGVNELNRPTDGPMSNHNSSNIVQSIRSNTTEVYKDPTPTPSVKNLPSDLSYAMTNHSSSYECVLSPGTMALAHGQVVHIISSSTNENSNTITYAVKAGNSIFITTSDHITMIPTLSKDSASTSSITISTKRSSTSKSTKSIKSIAKTSPPTPPFRPVDVVSIPDGASLGDTTIETSKTSEVSPIAVISDMRKEFLTELNALKHKETIQQNEISCLRQELGLLRPPTPPHDNNVIAVDEPLQEVKTEKDLTTKSMIDLIKALQTPPSFTIPPYDQKDGKNWLRQVIGLLGSSEYFSVLLTPDKTSLVPVCPASGTSANTNLYTRLAKSLTKEQLTILTGDDDELSTTSGLSILHCIQSTLEVEMNTGQARKKWVDFESIKLGTNETLAAYTTRIIQGAKTLEDTTYAQSNYQRNIKWRIGLGERFDLINNSIDILGSVPPGWGDDKNISVLLSAATQYSPDTKTPKKPKTYKPPPTKPPDVPPAITTEPPPTRPPITSPEERFQKHVRWMIGQNKFATQSGLEESPNYAGKRPNGCAYCFSDDHLWKNCNRIQGAKNAYSRANPQGSTQNTTPTPRPPANTPARRVTVPEEQTVIELNNPTTNNNNNENVEDYPSLLTLSNVVARVAKPIPYSTTTSSSLKMILDSGTTDHMSGNKSLFVQYYPAKNKKFVLLGDGSTTIPISGKGTIDYIVDSHRIILHNVYYVPQLEDTLYSIKQHITFLNCNFHAENNIMTLKYPKFTLNASIEDEVQVTLLPTPAKSKSPSCFNSKFAQHAPAHSLPECTLPNIPSKAKSTTIHTPKNPTTKLEDEQICNKWYNMKKEHLQATQKASRVTVPNQQNIILGNTIHNPVEPEIIDTTSQPNTNIQSEVVDKISTSVNLPKIHPALYTPRMSQQKKSNDQIHVRNKNKPRNRIHKDFRRMNDLLDDEELSHDINEFVKKDKQTTHKWTPNNKKPPKQTLPHKAYMSPEYSLHIAQNPSMNYEFETTSLLPNNEEPDTTTETELDDALQMAVDSEDHTISIPIIDPDTKPSRLPPTIRSIDTANASLPKTMSKNWDLMQKSVGYMNMNLVLKHLKTIALDTILVPNLGRSPITDRGEVATLPKRKRNTKLRSRPENIGATVHYDIAHGTGTAIGGVRYVLVLIDKASKHLYEYGLKTLKEQSILQAMKNFINDIGCKPTIMRADRDFKLIGGKVASYLETPSVEDNHIVTTHVSGAPDGRQNQNGLIESHWKKIMTLARSWLASHLLPTKFWYFAIKQAVQVCNYTPINVKNKWTTAFELMYQQKPDYRNLMPLFSVAYVKRKRDGTTHRTKAMSQTLRCICVGNDPKSDGLLFYSPDFKSLIGSADYTLDPIPPSGPICNIPYDGGVQFDLQCDGDTVHRPPAYQLHDTVYCTTTNLHGIIKQILIKGNDVTYLVKYIKSGEHVELQESELSDIIISQDQLTNDVKEVASNDTPLHIKLSPPIPWLCDGSKVTVFIPHLMKTPKRGFLKMRNSQWTFSIGRTKRTLKPFHIPLLHKNITVLITDNKIVSGWKTSSYMQQLRKKNDVEDIIVRRMTLRNTTSLQCISSINMEKYIKDNPPQQNITCKRAHVNASSLQSLHPPSSLKQHSNMTENDKGIWDRAYLNEYLGLTEDTNTWEYISEKEYQILRPITGNALPSMAISTIKKDADGNPIRAKYRIVVLGNLDPHAWTKQDCFAPVMSQLEFRSLIASAVKLQRTPKSGDFQNAFCQSKLPKSEQYIIRPPVNCPLTPPRTYLRLLKTLYGLKRSPRHWFELASKLFRELGLEQCPNAPCLFTGHIDNSRSRIYVGLYVDDFIYFGDSDEVENKFRERMAKSTLVTFENDPTLFLGIKIIKKHLPNGKFSIHLSQKVIIENLMKDHNLSSTSVTKPTPYRSGYPVDKVKAKKELPKKVLAEAEDALRSMVGSFNWIAMGTRPDISTITNILSHYLHCALPGHVSAAKHVLRYLIGTIDLGIEFSPDPAATADAFVKFPLNKHKTVSLTDANWGPQDQSHPDPANKETLELFKSRSLSGYLIWMGGPLHWTSKRQTITARSSAEAEIYAIDECVKALQHIKHIFEDLHLLHLLPSTFLIYNDNEASVKWTANMTTKGLRHIQMRENSTREQQQKEFCKISHLPGDRNLGDLFTKEDKNVRHFTDIRDALMKSSHQAYRATIHNDSNILYSLPHFVLSIRLFIAFILSCQTLVGGVPGAVPRARAYVDK